VLKQVASWTAAAAAGTTPKPESMFMLASPLRSNPYITV
jgi:hypothetical protein